MNIQLKALINQNRIRPIKEVLNSMNKCHITLDVLTYASYSYNENIMKLLLEKRPVSKKHISSWAQGTLHAILNQIASGTSLRSLSKQVKFLEYLISIGGNVESNVINANSKLFPNYKSQFTQLSKKVTTFRTKFNKVIDKRKKNLENGLVNYNLPMNLKKLIINKTLHKEFFE